MALSSFDEAWGEKELKACEWRKAIEATETKVCVYYSTQFEALARAKRDANDSISEFILALLSMVTSLHLRLDDFDNPFHPAWVLREGRSAIPFDFDATHQKFLRDILPHIDDAELKARIADVLSYIKFDHALAKLAVENYLITAQSLEDVRHWTFTADHVERAVQIAVKLGRKSEAYLSVIKYATELLEKCDGQDPLYLSAKLMEILLARKEGDPQKYALIAEKASKKAENEMDWDRARTYMHLKAQWHRQAGNDNAAREALLEEAQLYVHQAEGHLQREAIPNLMASHWIECAIEAYRRIGNSQEEIKELQLRLLDYQKKAVNEFMPISESVDISHIAQAAINSVKDKSFQEAILSLVLLFPLSKVDDLRAQVVQQRKDFVLQRIFPKTFSNVLGRVVAKQPVDEEEAIRADMWQNSAFNHAFQAQSVIIHALFQIVSDHQVRLSDFVPFVRNNPLVRPGREEIVIRGLHFGTFQDWLISTHLLIPQIEDSVRFVMENNGVIASGLDDKGIQEEYNLNRLLTDPTLVQFMEETFGKDLVFDMRGLLIERFGENLRNDSAHGLLSVNQLNSPAAVYLWWFALRFYCLPVIIGLEQSQAQSQDAQNEKPKEEE